MLHASLHVTRGHFVLDAAFRARGVSAVMGPNGAGKTTLLRAILGAERPQRGQITLDRRVLFDAALGVDVAIEERSIAYVPQGYGLFPHLRAIDNVLFGMPRGTDRRARAMELLRRLDISDASERYPHALSGGERQRVALARALAAEPRLLLLDEPLAALDSAARPRVRRFLSAFFRRTKLPAIVVTHDALDARAFAQHILLLEQGRIVQTGTADEIATHPATEHAATLSPLLLASSGEVDHHEALDEDE